MDDAVLMTIARLQGPVERLVHTAVHVDDGTEACPIHHGDHLRVAVGRLERSSVEVEIDRGKLRPRDVRPLHDQQTFRHRVLLGRLLEIRVRRALARAGGGDP
jgi:hypothetical protein